MLPKLNSAHGSETRNIINRAIDLINTQGKAIQDLVAEGQLTEEQYSNLINTVNGMLKSGEVGEYDLTPELRSEVDKVRNKLDKGDVSVYDIDKNKGKFDQTWMAEEFLQQMAGNTPINAVPADNSLTTEKYVNESVTPIKTDFFVRGRNLADLNYYENWSFIEENGEVFIQGYNHAYHGQMQVIPVDSNTTYTIKIHEPELSNRFRVAISNQYPSFDENNKFQPDRVIKNDDNIQVVTLTTDATTSYLFVYTSNNNMKPQIQVEEGETASETLYPSLILPEELVLPSIEKQLSSYPATVIEDPTDGYGDRPDVKSVTWIGVSEPKDASPYDEWRKVGGFTYFTDFNEYAIGEDLHDWQDKLSSGNIIARSSSSAPSGDGIVAEVQINQSSNPYLVSWNKIERDVNKNDAEVYFSGRLNALSDASDLNIMFRQSGDDNQVTGYHIGPRIVDGRSGVTATKYVDGETTRLESLYSDVDFNQYFNMVGRIEGPNLKLKVWQFGDEEPENWIIDIIDPEIPEGDNLGLFMYRSNAIAWIDVFSVGTGGMRAPRKRLIL